MNEIEIIEVTEIPRIEKVQKTAMNVVLARLDEIMSSNIKYGKIVLHDNYSNLFYAYTSLHQSAKRHGYPLQFIIRRNELYFARLDLM